MSGVEKLSPRRPLVAELNPHLMCVLCGGYFVDAAAIIECLHTFCRSCLVRYLETNKYCPICDVQVHKTRPLQNIRPDPTLQDIVYKLVPGLYHKEMKCRREFYAMCPNAPPSSLEDRGDVPPELCPFYTPDETVNLVLEYCPPDESDPTSNIKEMQNKRFLRCPAAVKITHLEKLLRSKYGLDNRYNIELMLDDSKLRPELSLMDVAYAFGRKRKGQFLFTYRIYDSQCKKMRLSDDEPDEEMRPLTPLISQVGNDSENVPPVETILSSAETTATTTVPTSSVVATVSVPVTTAPLLSACTSSAPPFVPLPQTVTLATASLPSATSVTFATSVAPVTIPVAAGTTITPVSTSVTSVSTSVTSVTHSSTSVTTSTARVTTPFSPATSHVPVTPMSVSVTSVTIPLTRVQPVVTPRSAPAVTSASLTQTGTTTSVSTSCAMTTTPVTVTTPVNVTKTTVSNPSSQPAPVTSASTPTTPTEGKSKLDSIISRLGDPSKHPRPESNPKQQKTHGKEVQLRISENGVMKFTSMGLLDKFEKSPTAQTKPVAPPPPPCSPLPKQTTKVGHSVKVAENPASSESAPKQGSVAPLSPSVAAPAASPRKPSSSPVGYKTLKSGPKSWNPTISRNSYLSAKLEQQQQQQLQKQSQQNKDSASSGSGTKPPTPEVVAKPPRFFKARNTPRYLGNPASGVKPMYQISSPPPVQKPPVKTMKPAAVLKIDPRTLTPITTSVAVSSPPPPPQTNQKDRPPFLSTTIAGASNHTPSSRATSTSTTVTESVQSISSSKLSCDLAMRNSSTLAYHMRYLPFCDPLNPFGPRLGDASPTPYPGMLRPPFSPLLVNSFGPCRPPPVGMLYNPTLHRQLNHQGPLSPVPGLPSPLPPPPAPLSPSSTSKSVIPPAHWTPSSPSSPVHQSKPLKSQSSTSKSSSLKVLPSKVTEEQTKVNGENSQVKDKSAKVTDEPFVKPGAEKVKKVDEIQSDAADSVQKEKNCEQENNNTVVVEKKSVVVSESAKDQPKMPSQQLSHNISKLCNLTPAGKESPSPGIQSSSIDQSVTATK